MRRTALPIGLAVALALAGSIPAGAGGCVYPPRAVVMGPGLLPPIDVRGDEALELVRRLGILPARLRTGPAPPPPADTGPRYEVIYLLRVRKACAEIAGGRASLVVHQSLYPYAEDRPWAFTPPGQRFYSASLGGTYRVLAGWWGPLDTEPVLDLLAEHGLPPRPPGEPVWIGPVAIALLWAALAASRRRRRSRPAPPGAAAG